VQRQARPAEEDDVRGTQVSLQYELPMAEVVLDFSTA